MWTTISLIALAIGIFYEFLIWNFDYWKKRGVKSPKPLPFAGNYPSSVTQKRHLMYDIDDLYRAHKYDEDFIGIFSFRSPQLLIINPTLVHRVFVNDFKHFHDNEFSTMIDSETDSIFGNNPFILTGEAWKERRALLTPGLTIGRVKTVYPVTNKVCHKMRDYIKDQIKMAPKDGIEAKDLCLRFTTEVVTDCVLGLQAESFSDKPTPIVAMIKRLFTSSFTFIIFLMVVGMFPFIKKFYKVRIMKKDVEKFFSDLMQTALDVRKSQPQQKDRADFLNYMLQLQEKKNLTTLDLTSNTMTFLIDGFETSAAVIAHTLLLLGRYPNAQKRLRDEILQHVGNDGVVDFEKLVELPYLDACVHVYLANTTIFPLSTEAIRVFPPGFFSNKLCTEPIVLSGKNGRSVKLEKGDVVILPLSSIMSDEDYYPNAKEFQPERFLAENGSTVKDFRERGLYYGFGDGPRVCIGMKFALVQVKAAVVEIISNFNVRVNPKTRKDDVFDPKTFIANLKGGAWLDFETIN